MNVDKQSDRIAGLVEVASSMIAERDLERLLTLIMDRATEFVDAERSSLYLIVWVSYARWSASKSGIIKRKG